jgi:V8-like Glu-specific endopeptidase
MARFSKLFAVTLALILGPTVGTAISQPIERSLDPDATIRYWTAERYLRAVPIVPEKWHGMPSLATAEDLAQRGSDPTELNMSAAPPSVVLLPDLNNQLFKHKPASSSAESAATSPDVGQAKAYFTSSRLIPLEADLFYPYRAVGKLFFTVPGAGPSECSGAVIGARLILTAGHCVHNGKSSTGFYTNFEFVPAFRDGVAPWGRWPAVTVAVTTTWATGQGKVPNAADYAILEVQDLQGTDGNVYRIGDVVGKFGVAIASLKINHVHMLGYPVAFDGGNKMHQVSSASLKYDPKTNTVAYGSDMTPGSSGGPWVQNFGVPAAGQTPTGGITALNRIVGVMSFVSASPLPKIGGSSVPDARLTALLSASCARKPGNC